MHFARSDLDTLTPYAHAVDVSTLPAHPKLGRVLRLGSNENPLGPSPLAVQAMQDTAAEAGRYPQADSAACIQSIAEHTGMPPEQLVVGNGGDECIDLLVRVLGRTTDMAGDLADAVLACRPCFDVYRTQAVVCGLRFLQVPLKPDFSLPLESLARLARETPGRAALVFVTTPDNPSGLATPRQALLELACSLPQDTFLMVDEAYVDFCDAPEEASCLPLMRPGAAHPAPHNLGVLRTFSKAYGLAGARLGYMALPAALAECCRRALIPFSVNRFAQAAATAALADSAHYQRSVELARAGRALLLQGLRKLGCEVPQSSANFVMLRPPCDAEALFKHLLTRGILLRNLSPNGLPGWLRATVGLEEECEALLEAVGEFVGR